jgi:ornithine--oxo-acid transaminase
MTSTFGGNPLVCAGVVSVLNLLTEELLSRVGFLGEIFLERLRSIKNKKIIEVRGKGLLIGVELSTNVTVVLKRMQDRGVLAAPAGDGRVVRFLPPYVITEQEIDRATAAFEKALDD